MTIVGIFTIISSGVCFAEEDVRDNLCNKWNRDLHQEVVKLIQGFLNGDSSINQNRALKEVVRVQVMLGTCSADQGAIYLDDINPDDLAGIPGQILMTYLDNRGVSLEARKFFQGQKITYLITH